MPQLDLLDLECVPSELRSVAVDDLCVYIDPLDATKEYTLGKTWCVMTLIGITLRGQPVAGVMHQPFAFEGGENGHTIYALKGYGVVKEMQMQEEERRRKKKKEEERRRKKEEEVLNF